MCLAIPMKITEVKGDETAVAETDAGRQEVNISLVADLEADDYVIVHAGFAIEKLDKREAEERICMFQDLARTTQ